MKRRLLTVAATLVLVPLATACGSSPASPAGSPGGAGTTEATTTEQMASARTKPRRIDPRRNGLEVAMGEWAVQLEAKAIRPGPVTVVVANRGTTEHGFEIEV